MIQKPEIYPPKFRENHALSHSKDVGFPQVNEIKKTVEKINFSKVVTRKILEQSPPIKSKNLVHKVKKLQSYLKRSHLNNSVKRSFAKITGGKKHKNIVKSKNRNVVQKPTFKKKKSRINTSNLDRSDINDNSHSSLILENSIDTELDENLNESFDLLESSIVEANEVSKFRRKIINKRIGQQKNILDELNLSSDTNDFV